nr:retrovirus-related Pol polyprotein from transposon TNT 1-94 [Tanacetum cinerariifolium]
MPPKPDLVFNNAPTVVETDHPVFTAKLSPTKPDQELSLTNRSSSPIIEDWVSDSEDESETKTQQNVASFVQSTKQVKSFRPSVQHVETSIPAATPKPASPKPTSNGKKRNRKACFVCKSLDHLIKDCDYHDKKMRMVPAAVLTQSKPVSITAVRPHITRSPSSKVSNSPLRVTAVKALVVNAAQGMQGKWEWKPKGLILDPVSRNKKCINDPKKGNPQHALKDKGVIDSGCSRHMTRNLSYLSDFEELNSGYVAFGGNPKGGKIFGKGKIKTDSLLPILFWAKAVNTACYVHDRVLVTKPHIKTPYELLHSRTPSISFMRRFGCLVTILNTLDSLGKFDGKVDEGFLVGYSVSSKAFRVFNSRTRIVQETLHVNFLENKPNVAGGGPTWLFDIDTLTKTMNYQPVTVGNQSNPSAGFQNEFDAEKAGEESDQQYVLFPVWFFGSTNPYNTDEDDAFGEKEHDTNTSSAAGPSNAAASPTHGKSSFIDASQLLDDPDMPELEDITYSNDEDDVGAEADFNNLETYITISPIPTTRVRKDHHMTQIIEEPKRVHQALKDPSWIEAMQEELLQFKMQKVWVLVDLPYGKRAIGFENPDHPDKVYKVVKALYGLHQAPRACDYAGASLDRKSTTGGCQFLGCRLIFWQCKKQSVVATSSTKAEYVVAASCGAQVIWIQNQLLDYGPDQTVSGKDSSNPLMADNLPKNVWYSTHHVTLMKSWLVQKQTTLGKDKANPLIVDSLLKTIWSSIHHLLINEVLTIPGQTSTGKEISNPFMAVLLGHQFWTIVAVKKVNDVMRLQALVNKKKVVIMEATIREVLRLDEAEGVECLPNEEIFVELAIMGFKKPSTKLTFCKAFFSSQWKFLIHTILQCMSANLVRNVDSPTKFYMYPRFLQLMIRKQVGDFSIHTIKYTSFALTHKVFANMRRVGKGFSRVETALFEGMLVAQEVEEGDADENVENVNAGDAAEGDVNAANDEVPTADEEPSIPSLTPPTPPPQPSQDIPSTSQAQPTPP